MQTQLLKSLPAHEYHATDAISVSGLKEILRSPRHYKHKYLDGNQEASKALEFGRAFHALVLEPERINEEVAVKPEKDDYPFALDTVDDMKKWLADRSLPVTGTKPVLAQRILEADPRAQLWGSIMDHFSAGSEGKSIIKKDEWTLAKDMAQEILNNAAARIVLTGKGHAEVSAFWTAGDGINGVPARARFDWLREDGLIVDIKTTTDASPEGFGKHAYNYGYHMQAWWYMRAYEAATGKKPEGFVFIAVEKDAPHCVGVYVACPEMLELGQRDCEAALGIYRECRRTGEWPGYPEQIEPLHLPVWAEKRLNQNVGA